MTKTKTKTNSSKYVLTYCEDGYLPEQVEIDSKFHKGRMYGVAFNVWYTIIRDTMNRDHKYTESSCISQREVKCSNTGFTFSFVDISAILLLCD